MRDGVYRILTLGDSVAWGQGLLEQDKYHALVAQHLPHGPGNSPPEESVVAHSGAVIGVGVQTVEPAADGEVPTAYPTILQQVAHFNNSPESVDLILMNGGINDVDIRDILNPLTDSSHLRDWIQNHCHMHMKVLLDQVVTRFSLATAKIVVTGYYPILSTSSDPDVFKPFLKVAGVAWLDVLGDAFEDPIKDKIAKNCRLFCDLSTEALQQAVNEANNSPTGNGRILFVDAGFGPDNSVMAPNAWLFGIGDDLDFSPQDEVIDARRKSCDRDETDVLQRWVCYRASAGHPNKLGAAQYANQILASLKEAGFPIN